MQLNAAWGDPATAEAPSSRPGPLAPLVQVNQTAQVRNFAEAEALGEAVAAQLRAGGAVWAGKGPDA
jgi:hydroxymethylbilane synthase